MVDKKIIYICSHCDAQYPKWLGRCSECGQWGTINQIKSTPAVASEIVSAADAVSLSDIKIEEMPRIKSGINEFDRVLGNGIVPASLVLIGGEPGIGKSTLILQVAQNLARVVLYVSGEESANQIKMRLDRLNLKGENIQFLGETDVDTITATILKTKPLLTIIDSIQTIHCTQLPSEAGSINQVRACTVKLLEAAKKSNSSTFIIGHITKEGVVAGPKTLEHLVDTVIYLEGERYHQFRILRTVKNRFGTTNELGIFEMTNLGLKEITNPTGIFLSDKKANFSGSVTTPTMEGTRIFIAEIQALINPTHFGYPLRKTIGFDLNRLSLLTAVLTRRINLKLANQDIHLNVAGGLKINEPAADLAVVLAIASAYKNREINPKTTAFGEVGLGGEIRPVNQVEKRIKEAEKIGFQKIIMPNVKTDLKTSCELIKVDTVKEAMEKIIGNG